MLRRSCPKCLSKVTWYQELENGDWFHRCLCGYSKIVYSHVYGAIGEIKQPKLKLPKEGTRLWQCLQIAAKHYPKAVYTGEAANELRWESCKTATFMSVLQSRGLLEKDDEARGKVGGSSWRLTESAKAIIG